MPSANSLTGLMKRLTRDPWRDAFADLLDDHIGAALDEHEIDDLDELSDLIGADLAMTLWGCAFEDFLTREVEDAGNIVDDYLKRRGFKESARNRAYMAGLRGSVMSLYEVSDIRPGRSFVARDLLRGGEPVVVSERSATAAMKPWDRLALRLVDLRGTKVIGGGVLRFEHELSEQLIEAVKRIEDVAADKAAIVEVLDLDPEDPEVASALDSATSKTEILSILAPLFSVFYLSDLLDRIANPRMPDLFNSDGDDIEFMRLVYRLAGDATPAAIRGALGQACNLEAASDTFWNWLEPPEAAAKTRGKAKPRGQYDQGLLSFMADGSTVLGNIELKARTLELQVSSESRAERGRQLLEPLLGDLVGAPLIERQTLEQAMAEPRDSVASSDDIDLTPEERRQIIHEAMEQHYRAQLDEPVPLLGNVSPRKAARSKQGRAKVAGWLKRLENGSARHDPDDPMATYDLSWMWHELGVADLRR